MYVNLQQNDAWIEVLRHINTQQTGRQDRLAFWCHLLGKQYSNALSKEFSGVDIYTRRVYHDVEPCALSHLHHLLVTSYYRVHWVTHDQSSIISRMSTNNTHAVPPYDPNHPLSLCTLTTAKVTLVYKMTKSGWYRFIFRRVARNENEYPKLRKNSVHLGRNGWSVMAGGNGEGNGGRSSWGAFFGGREG